jgi:protein-disulfide isomerase
MRFEQRDVLRELLRDFTNVRYVWRHLPLTDVHVHAQLAAEAAEAASDQGALWETHDTTYFSTTRTHSTWTT